MMRACSNSSSIATALPNYLLSPTRRVHRRDAETQRDGENDNESSPRRHGDTEDGHRDYFLFASGYRQIQITINRILSDRTPCPPCLRGEPSSLSSCLSPRLSPRLSLRLSGALWGSAVNVSSPNIKGT